MLITSISRRADTQSLLRSPLCEHSSVKPNLAAAALAVSVLSLLLSPRVNAQAPIGAVAPELNAFFKLSDPVRVFLLGNLSSYDSGDPTGGELGAHLDITLMPRFRAYLRDADWARDRYFWTRIGYTVSGQVKGQGAIEHRGLLELTARVELPEQVWLVNRARYELRDIDSVLSQRYRLRTGIEREFTPFGVPTLPYAQAEILYDTRTDSWNRQIYQTGVEVEINKSWRYEVYFSRQVDSRSSSANIATLGLVLKLYR